MNTTLMLLLHFATWLGAAIILIFGMFFAINNMGSCTQHDIRFAWVFLSCGALAVFIMPNAALGLIVIGAALFVVADRRRCNVCPELETK